MRRPAGWYPDPSDPSAMRWWDGAAWTERSVQADRSSAPPGRRRERHSRSSAPVSATGSGAASERPGRRRPHELCVDGARIVSSALWACRRRRSLFAWGALVLVALGLVDLYAPVPTWSVVAPAAVVVAATVVGRTLSPAERTSPAALWRYAGAAVATGIAGTFAGAFAASVLPTVFLLVVLVAFVAAVLAFVRGLFIGGSPAPPKRSANSHVRADGRPKVAYRTRPQALRAAADYEQDQGGSMDAYRCATCSRWHIGHSK